MATYIKSSIRSSTAQSLLEDMERNTNQYFFFIGRSIPWDNDQSPDQYSDTVKNEYDLSRNIIGYKKIRAEDILFAIRRYDWIGGTIYDQYTDSEELFDLDSPKIFYVYTIARHIYKCLNNSGGSPSTSLPDLVVDNPFTLEDGYVWKYLGTVSEDNEPDTLTTFLPVEYITTSSDTQTQNQYNTQLQAKPGEITRIDIPIQPTGTTSGIYQKTIKYDMVGGLVVNSITAGNTAGYNVLEITDPDSISLIDAVLTPQDQSSYPWTGYILRIADNDNNIAEIGNYAVITSWNNANKLFTIRDDVIEFALTTGGDSVTVEILPFIKVIGDGVGCYVYPGITGDIGKKQIDSVVVGDGGSGYSHAVLDIIANPKDTTTSPILPAVISPKGGHGSNILSELNSTTVFVSIELDETDQDDILTGGTYRQFGIIKNPKLNYPKGAIAGEEISSRRDITLLNLTSTSTTTIANKFPEESGSSIGTVLIFGTESLSSVRIIDKVTANDTTKKITVSALSAGSDALITTQSRSNDYLLGIGKSIVNFVSGEEVTQYIPAGTTFAVLGIAGSIGTSYGFGVLAKGIVLSLGTTMSGNTLGVRITENNFVVGAAGATLNGSVSGATGIISDVSSRFGEIVHTIGLCGGATFSTQNSFKVLEIGPYYFSGDVLYTGLNKIKLTDSTNGLTASSYSVGDVIIQGSTGNPNLDFASGTVYRWDNISTATGVLHLTDMIGTFKTSGVYGITASLLSGSIVRSISGVTLADIDVTSGEIIYIDNVVPIDRVQNQKENFRLTVNF